MEGIPTCKSVHLVGKRLLSLVTAVGLAAAAAFPAAAAERIGDGVSPTYDEAYYATLDHYGNLIHGSVVKSYTLHGASSLTDYGTYDEVVNLTDGTLPTVTGDTTTFSFAEDSAPSHFYFEGKTDAPFAALPWTLSVTYSLNGVASRAEDVGRQDRRGGDHGGCHSTIWPGVCPEQLYPGSDGGL